MYLHQSYDSIFSSINELLSQGKHLSALTKLESLIYSSNEQKFEHLLILYKINNEGYIPFKNENPVKELWDNLEGITSPFLQHETFIVSFETAITLKQVNALNDLMTKMPEFKRSANELPPDLKNYFEAMVQFLLSMYYIRININYRDSIENLKYSLKLVSSLNFPILLIQVYHWLGYAFYKNGDSGEGYSNFAKSLDLAQKIKNDYWRARNFHYIGKIYSDQENWDKSIKQLHETVDLYGNLGLKSLQSGALMDVVSDLFQVKDFEKISIYLHDRLTLAREFNLTTDFISSSYWLAYFYEYTGDIDRALETYQQTLEYLNKIQYWDEIHRCSAHISYLNAHKHDQLPTHLDWKDELQRSPKPWKIVIVCNGNISRSPYVEYILKKTISENYSILSTDLTIESMGVLYPNVKMNYLTEKFLEKEGFTETEIEKHLPRYWENYPEIHENASIFVTVTGEQAQLLNFYYPGKAFMLSFVAEGSFKNIIDPAIHRADAEHLFEEMKKFTLLFAESLNKLKNE